MKKKRSVLNSPRLNELKKKKRKSLWKKILLCLFVVAMFLIGVTYLSRIPKLNINNIIVTGNKNLDTDMIKIIVNNDLSGHYMWLFPKTNFLIFPKHTIEKDLSTNFKRAKDISANIRGTKTLDIVLSERTALYTWCGETPTTDVEKCYFMDDSGYIFDDAPYFSGNVYFKFFGKITNDTNETDSPLGSYFMKDSFQKFLSLRDTFKSMGVKVSSLLVKDDGDAEFYLDPNIPAPDAPKIMFKANDDFNKLAENLQAALTTEPLQTDFAKKYSSLSYIDLRFGNKVYYKFSGQGVSASAGN